MNGRVGNALLFILTFFFVFPPIIKTSYFEVPIPLILSSLLSVLFLSGIVKGGGVGRYVAYPFFSLVIVALYFLMVSAFVGFQDLIMVKSLVYFILFLFGSCYLVYLYQSNYGPNLKYLLFMFYVGVVHSVIMVLVFISYESREFLYSYVVLTEVGQNFLSYGIRSPGLTSGGGAALSVIQAMLLICGLQYVVLCWKTLSNGKLVFLMALMLIVFISIALSGRTGFVVLFLWVVYSLLFKFIAFPSKSIINLISFMKRRFVSILIVAAVFSVSIIYVDFSKYEAAISMAFEMYFNYSETGKFESRSTSHIVNEMVIFPSSEMQFMFGDGNFGRSSSLDYLPTDIGYIRIIFGSGVVGILVLSLILFVMVVCACLYGVIFPIRAVFLFSILVMFLVNFKELFFVTTQGWPQVMCLLYFSLFNLVAGRKVSNEFGVVK